MLRFKRTVTMFIIQSPFFENQVRVREDHGEVETADGEVVLLKAGSQHHLPRWGMSIILAVSTPTVG